MKRSESINELAASLAKAQSVMAAAAKDSNNPFFKAKYADLASCWDAWRPAGPPNGLALLQFPTATEERLDPPITVQADGDRKAKTIHFIQRVSVETILVHSSGQFVSETLTVLVKDDSPQATLLGETYCRRGGMSAIIGIAPDDDDGHSAANHDADFGQRDTKPKRDVPQCPKCGKQGESVIEDKFKGGFKCWEKRGGCGNHWLPDDERPPAEPPRESKANGNAKQVAAEHGLTTGDKLAPPKEPSAFQKANEEISKAVRNRDREYLAKLSKAIAARTKEGVFTQAEDASLVNEIELAEKKINAADKEPARHEEHEKVSSMGRH